MTRLQKIIFVVYGMLLGVCMGALSALASLTLLDYFGRPNFLIRPGWEIFEIMCRMAGGGLAGLFFGTLLCGMKRHPNIHREWLLSHILMLLGASLVYFGFDYFAIKWRIVILSLASNFAVFLWCLAVIYFFGSPDSDQSMLNGFNTHDDKYT
jgi:hypothetical protein